MEGGSRQSRAASRYGGATAATAAFNGPVRKWKKQWVSATSPSKTPTGSRKEAPPLLLRRWTPLSAADDDAEPPKRRFRYAPIVPIVRRNKKGGKEVGNEGAASSMSVRNGANNGGDGTSESEGVLEKPDNGDVSMEEEAPELSKDPSESLLHGSYYEQKKGD